MRVPAVAQQERSPETSLVESQQAGSGYWGSSCVRVVLWWGRWWGTDCYGMALGAAVGVRVSAPAGRGSDPTGGAACGAALDWDGGRPEFRRGHESRAGRRRGVMPRRRHDAAHGERWGKVRGGEDVRWRACMAVWGAK